jgi:prevent-host-death family protein
LLVLLVGNIGVPVAKPAINLETDIQALSDFRANAAAVIKQVRDTRRPVVLTQRGRSAAVLLDVSSYQALVDELDLLRDIHLGIVDGEAGNLVEQQDAREQVLARYR